MNTPSLYQDDAIPVSFSEMAVGNVASWLTTITRPVAAGSAVDHSIDFAVLRPDDGRQDNLDSEDLACLSESLEAVGLDPKQIIVRNDTVDFNTHHIESSPGGLIGDHNPQTYSIADNVFGIFWTWDPLACSTRGLLWHSDEEGHRQARFIWEGLSRLGLTHRHGLLPALLTLQVEITEMRVWIDNQAEAIMASQILTGHHAYADGSFSARARGSSHDFPMLDLAMMSKRVCGLAINITTSALCLQRIVQLADFILEDASNSIRNQQLGFTGSMEELHSFNHAGSIIQRTRSAKRQAEGLLAEAEAWKHKATIMVQTLLSLTTQRDQTISISIAEDSRTLARKVTRDSKSMKAIAAVTMCFLPGTFVASLFAMSMFDWNAGTGSSATVDRHFWIYWAVTLPLTVAVIVVWLVWTNKDLLPIVRKLKGRRPKTEKHEEIYIPAQT